MLLAVKENGIHDAVKVDSVLATEMIGRAINKFLDDGIFNIADMVRNPAATVYKSYIGLNDSKFFNVRHKQSITRDPLHRFDPVITYNADDYILFDLDENKIVIPDFYDHDDDIPLYATTELESYYLAYTYAASTNTQHKPLKMAYQNKWILVDPQIKHNYIDGSLIRSTFMFREYKPKSEIFSLDYCYCCGTFECKCTEKQLNQYCKDLPF